MIFSSVSSFCSVVIGGGRLHYLVSSSALTPHSVLVGRRSFWMVVSRISLAHFHSFRIEIPSKQLNHLKLFADKHYRRMLGTFNCLQDPCDRHRRFSSARHGQFCSADTQGSSHFLADPRKTGDRAFSL